MTIQTVSPAADGVMLLAAAGVLGLSAATVVQMARRRPRSAAALGGAAAVVVVAYVAVLLGAGLASRPQQLRAGDAKCFDDWCATLMSAHRDGASGTWLVDVQLQNRGRGRAMRSNLGRAYFELPGGARVAPEDGRAMQTLLEPGQRMDVQLCFAAPADVRDVRFVVAEGAGSLGPGTFEIGGEGSPFHARAGWPLS